MKLSLERLARRIAAELNGGGTMLPILSLSADPTTTPTAGAQTQYGVFSGTLYEHLTAATDTQWLNLGSVKLLVDELTPLLALAGQEGPLLSLASNVGDILQSIPNFVTLAANPMITPPATNYRPGTIGKFPGTPDHYYLKVRTDNQADGTGGSEAAGSWTDFQTIGQIFSSIAHADDDAYVASYPVLNLWIMLNTLVHDGGGNYFRATMDRINNAGVGNLVFAWAPSVNAGTFTPDVGAATATASVGRPAFAFGKKLIGCALHTDSAFGGGTVATARMSVGMVGHDNEALVKQIDVMDTTAGGNIGKEGLYIDLDGDLTFTITITGDTLEHLTAGECHAVLLFAMP